MALRSTSQRTSSTTCSKPTGACEPSLPWRLIELQRIGSFMAALPTLNRGTYVQPSKTPALPLELYSFEASPFARPVRERLCELELPYLLRSVGRTQAGDWIPPALRRATGYEVEPQSRNRRRLKEIAGSVSVPYLVDPNRGEGLAESTAILDYLATHYAA